MKSAFLLAKEIIPLMEKEGFVDLFSFGFQNEVSCATQEGTPVQSGHECLSSHLEVKILAQLGCSGQSANICTCTIQVPLVLCCVL